MRALRKQIYYKISRGTLRLHIGEKKKTTVMELCEKTAVRNRDSNSQEDLNTALGCFWASPSA